jgi:hypothetical protein
MERELSREAAERLLSGDSSSPPSGTESLAFLLAAASAPPRLQELAGEGAALAAFRAHSPTVRRWSLRRVLTIKVAAVVAATVAAGGVAFASSAGLLPNPFTPPSVDGTSPGSGSTPGGGGTPTPGASLMPDVTGSLAAEGLSGLCKAYEAKPPSERGKALQSTAFSTLVSAAGGVEHVSAYCTNLLSGRSPAPAASPDHRPNGTPTPPPASSKSVPTKSSR